MTTNLEKELRRRAHAKHENHEDSEKNNHHSHNSNEESSQETHNALEEKITLLQKQIEEKDQIIKDNEEKMKLVAADFINSRNRLQKEIKEKEMYAINKFALAWITILEEMELSISHFPKDLSEKEKSMLDGIQMIKTNVLSTLANFSIIKIDIKKGDKFDYNLHQAVSMIKDENAEKGTICEIFQNGYKISDRILKPAVVSVVE